MDSEISSRQARALMRFTDKFTVVFSDVEGGIDKAYSGIDPLIEEGGSVKVATLVEHVNVLDTIERKSFDRLATTIRNAKSLLEYQLRRIKSKYDVSEKDGKDAFILEAKDYILAIKERSKQEPFISVLSKMAGVREDSIRKVFYEDKEKTSSGTKRITNKRSKDYSAMMTLLALDRAGYELGEDISPLLYGEYLGYYEKVKAGEEVNLSAYFNDSEMDMLSNVDVNDKNNAKIAKDCIKTLKKYNNQRKQDALVDAIEKESDLEKKKELMMELNKLVGELRSI